MDDFNMNVMSEAKGEWSARLVSILTPLIMSGIHSIFKEACTLCEENDEHSKYLMTFQNFLARIPKWNSTIIQEETDRIINDSQCGYLEDMLTCVHITKLKMLTSMRVSDNQKKIDIDIPKLSEFVHRVYCKFARKLYSNIYLFEKNVPPLQYQKNMRECELLIRESILEVIRDNMPVEQILRAYMDKTITEEVVEEIVEKTTEEIEQEKAKREAEEKEKEKENKVENSEPTTIVVEKPKEDNKSEDNNNKPEEKATVVEDEEVLPDLNLDDVVGEKMEESAVKTPLTFNDNDSVLDMGTNEEKLVNAPKTPERLDQIATERNEQRKLEEAEDEDEDDDDYEDERLVIKDNETIKLEPDVLGIESLKPINSSELLLGEVELL
tara:strand:+ start:406 stop:1551 length:1146 start_codon:yes stop_codon:yes gene_type:complete